MLLVLNKTSSLLVINIYSTLKMYKIIYHIFSDIRQSFFSFQNNPKDLDLSYKMDLDLLDCLGRVKLVL